MKKIILQILVVAFAVIGLTNCSKDDNPGTKIEFNQQVGEYYFRAKSIQGDINFVTYHPDTFNDGTATGMRVNVMDEIGIDFKSSFSEGAITNLEGKTIGFGAASPAAYIITEVDGLPYSSANVDNQAGSEFEIETVERIGYYYGRAAYKLTGIFNCMIDNEDNTDAREFTDGEFKILIVY